MVSYLFLRTGGGAKRRKHTLLRLHGDGELRLRGVVAAEHRGEAVLLHHLGEGGGVLGWSEFPRPQ